MTFKRWQTVHWTYLAFFICLLFALVCVSTFACLPIATAFTLHTVVAKLPNSRNIKCRNDGLIGLITGTPPYSHGLIAATFTTYYHPATSYAA